MFETIAWGLGIVILPGLWGYGVYRLMDVCWPSDHRPETPTEEPIDTQWSDYQI